MERNEVAYELVKRIACHPRFISEAAELRQQYPNLSDCAGWCLIEDALEKNGPSLVGETNINAVQNYHDSVLALCKHFNIPYDWAPEHMHAFIRPGGLHMIPSVKRKPVTISPVIKTHNNRAVQFTVTMWPEVTKQQVLKEIEKSWGQAKDILKTLPKVKRSRAETQSESHIDWLYQSVVLGKTSLEIYSNLLDKSTSDKDCRSPETIKGAINCLAKTLGIPLRRGRKKGRRKV